MIKKISDDDKKNLISLYNCYKKHGNYQQLPQFVSDALSVKAPIDERWRGDGSRLEYLLRVVEFSDTNVIDIGANTGYFALNLAHSHQARVIAIEPTLENCNFLSAVKSMFDLVDLEIQNRSISLNDINYLPNSDIIILLNVLHHAGSDFASGEVIEEGELYDYIVKYLSALTCKTKRLIFQMGFNWCGDKSQPIVPTHDNIAKARYVGNALRESGWVLDLVGMPYDPETREMVTVDHHAWLGGSGMPPNADASPLELLQKWGITKNLSEFYSRPMFICSLCQESPSS